MTSRKPNPAEIFLQIKVSLKRVKPEVWRRLVIPASLRLPVFHVVLQKALGWTNSHLHSFRHEGCFYEVVNPDSVISHSAGRSLNELEFAVGDLLKIKGDEMGYEYDMGDFWEHQVVVEEVLNGPQEFRLACLDGARAAPLEDCGGPSGYKDLLRILANPKHPEYSHMIEWTGGPVDPEVFDRASVNRALRRIKA